MLKQLQERVRILEEENRLLKSQQEKKEWLTRKEAAEYMQVNPLSITRYVRVYPALFDATGLIYRGAKPLYHIDALNKVGSQMKKKGRKKK